MPVSIDGAGQERPMVGPSVRRLSTVSMLYSLQFIDLQGFFNFSEYGEWNTSFDHKKGPAKEGVRHYRVTF